MLRGLSAATKTKKGVPSGNDSVTMDILALILQIALLAIGLFVIVAVLMQQGKAHGLSGAIAGGADTFFGKEKGNQFNSKLGKWTTWLSIAFVVIVFVLYVIHPEVKFSQIYSADNWSISPYEATTVTEYVDV